MGRATALIVLKMVGLTRVAPCTPGGRWGPLNVYSGCLMYLVHFHVVINCAETVSGLLVTSLSIFFLPNV